MESHVTSANRSFHAELSLRLDELKSGYFSYILQLVLKRATFFEDADKDPAELY